MEKQFAIRLSFADLERLKAAVRAMGPEGERSLKALEAAAKGADSSMKGMGGAVGDLRRAFDEMADRIPVIGGLLKSIGPAGLALAATFTGVGMAAGNMAREFGEAIEEMDRIYRTAKNMAVSSESFQVFEALAIEKDLDIEKLAEGMNKLQMGAALATKGQGELFATLKRVNPAMLDQVVAAETQEDRWNVLNRAITESGNQLDKVAIAKAAFGEKGAQFVRLLEGESQSIEALTKRYKEMGVVIEESIIARAAEADRAMDMQDKRMKVLATEGMAGLISTGEWLKTTWADINVEVGLFFNQFAKEEDQHILTQKRRMEEQGKLVDATMARWSEADKMAREMEAEGDKRAGIVREEANAQRELFYERQQEFFRLRNLVNAELNSVEKGVAGGGAVEDPAETARKEAEAERLRKEAIAERARMEQEAIAIRATLGDWSAKLAKEEERLNELVAAGALTREAANAQLARSRAELDGSAAAQKRWAAVVEGGRNPVEKAMKAIRDFDAEVAKFGDLAGVDEDAVRRVLVDVMMDAAKAAREATPAFKDVADARGRIKDHALDLLSVEQLLAIEQERLNGLVGQHGFTSFEAAKALEAYEASLRGARGASFELAFALETTDAIFNQQIKSLEDLQAVALRVFQQVAIEAIRAQSRIKGSGFLDFMQAGFSAITSVFGFGGGGAGLPGAGNVNGAGSGIGTAVARVHHYGGVAGDGVAPIRILPAAVFSDAPRFHSGTDGFAADEYPAVLQRGEPVVSRWDANRIVRALDRSDGAAGGGNMQVNIHPPAGYQAETKESRGASGGKSLDVTFHKMVGDAMMAGAGKTALDQIYGVKPRAAG